MEVLGSHAWVTSAVEDKTVKKAIVLAGSLRRVFTSKPIAILTTTNVAFELREKLEDNFDHVQVVDPRVPSGYNLEDYVKVYAFSLKIFNKCVYLSPESIILRNCDDIFEKYETFAACRNDLGEFDFSVYFYTTNLEYVRALEKNVGIDGNYKKGNFSKWFGMWLSKNLSNISCMDDSYNLKINFDLQPRQSLNVNASIANFFGGYPLDMELGAVGNFVAKAGPMEKIAVNTCFEIYSEIAKLGFKMKPCLPGKYSEPVAIVGLSFRLPGGNNEEEFWNLLENGKEGVKPLPPFRWTKEHSLVKCRNRNVEAGFLDFPVDEFDAKFFGLSPKEAESMDPQQRLLHEVSWEALEDAMVDPHSLKGTNTGFFVGSWIYDYTHFAIKSHDFGKLRTYMGNSLATEAARLSHFFQTTGPSIATESACSSSIVAVHLACKSLQKHETNLAVACAVNLHLHPIEFESMGFVLSADGRCKTFDANADGFGRAEAVTALVLKRLSDAVKDGDNIWGLIRGSAVTQEGISKSLGTPTVHCESLAMTLALQNSGVQPQDVDFVETHGTGTSVGDPLEIAAICKAYSTPARRQPLVIGSVKTNVGHTESACGMTGIIKVLLSMKNEKIPPHLNLKTLNPAINLEAIPAEIPLELRPWPKRENGARFAGVSSFGFSGTDGHAIIQDPPLLPNYTIHYGLERPKHIMKISAKSSESMEQLLTKYERICNEKADLVKNDKDFADLAYSANTGRADFNKRAVIIANDFVEAAKILKEKSFEQKELQGKGSKLCFLFTGQGSQYPNMASNLYQTSPLFRSHFDECDEVLRSNYGIDIRTILWGKDEAELSRTLYSQTSIFVVEYCLLKLWASWGVIPDYVMGHSLGEFAAACAADALNIKEALMLVAERSCLIDKLPGGAMLVIKTDQLTVEKHVAKFQENNPKFWLDYAATNAPDQTVVAGDSENVKIFEAYCKEKSLKTIVLSATHAFHSRHMDPMLKPYENVASSVKKPVVNEKAPKFISGVEGKVIPVNTLDAKYWVRHTREKVSFIEACKAAQEEGCTLFLEVGPHPVLSALVMANIEGQSLTCLPSLRRGKEEWNVLLESLAKLYLSDWKGEVDWKGFDQYYKRTRVPLPFYPFNRKPLWVQTRHCPDVLHPLLGKILPNASGKTVFESELTLKTVDYIQDHVFGNHVVFPGACFLETCLAGGFSTVQGFTEDFSQPKKHVVLKNLQIHSPLPLYDSKLCVLQTIVNFNQDEENALEYSVGIFRHDDSDPSGGGHWSRHASAKYLPVPPSLPPHITANVDVVSIQSTWETSDTVKEFYEVLPEVGLRFGSRLQSLGLAWRSIEKKAVLMQVKVPGDTEKYLIHPVVADGMIQALLICYLADKGKIKKLHVPVRVGEFIWLGKNSTQEYFIYCAMNPDSRTRYAAFLDGNGDPLAYMDFVEFAETSVKMVESMFLQQQTAMPNVWEEIYKNVPGPTQTQLIFKENVQNSLEIELMHNPDNQFYIELNHICKLYFIEAMAKLGWEPEMGRKFTANNLLKELKIHEEFLGYCHFFLKQLSELAYFEIIEKSEFSSEFSLKKPLPGKDESSQFIQKASADGKTMEQFRLVTEIGQNLKLILTGEISPLQVLCPTESNSNNPSSQRFSDELINELYPVWNEYSTRKIIPSIKDAIEIAKQSNIEKPTVRILEIGAGTGLWSCKFLKLVKEAEILDFQYWYTDISDAFKRQGEKIFAECPKNLNLKKINMEEDPLEQGLYPEYFDLVLAAEVILLAKDVTKTLKNIRAIMKPGSSMQIIEPLCTAPVYTFVHGVLKDYWNFEDFNLRPDHFALSASKWKDTLELAGFCNIFAQPIYQKTYGIVHAVANMEPQLKLTSLRDNSKENHSWIVFSNQANFTDAILNHLESLNRKVIVVEKPKSSLTESIAEQLINQTVKKATEIKFEGIIYAWGLSADLNETDQSLVGLPFFSVCKAIAKMEGKKAPKIIVLTQGQFCIEESEMISPVAATLSGIAKSVSNELSFNILQMDLCPGHSLITQINEILANIWTSNESTIAFRNGRRFCPKLASSKIPNNCLSIPNGCDRFQLILPESKVINDLEFGYLEPFNLSETEVEVEIKAMALNFRDVFAVLKPSEQFANFNAIGVDFAGVVVSRGPKVTKWQVGDRVMGMNEDLCLPSHINIQENMITTLQQNMTFAEGATFPTVVCTVLHSIVNVAKIKKGETLLLHTASGGVGLCAIQVANHIGVNIIATAGSKRKRNYLHNLGIQHVFNSRTTEFGKQILQVTQGKGVDVVLNSLTGEGFIEASLTALGKNGRFVEMSKLNTWTPEEVKALRPDIFYKAIDITQFEMHEKESLNECLDEYVKLGFVRPIPYETFDALNIRGALYYMQKAKHIGKIVCLMPEVKIENSKFITETKLFNEQSTYIITGGLGGIGFEVAKFMLTKGAKHIALVNRSKPSDEIEKVLNSLNSCGKHIEAFSVDVGNIQQCFALFENLNLPSSGFPTIRGVMHCAGVLSDAMLTNQNWETFRATFHPKVSGTLNLHELTKDLVLEHFVVFSSIAATLGSPGQANYAAGNNFQDAVALYRRSSGLMATSVNWGNWGEVGMAREIDFPGIRPISTKQGLLALETVLKTQTSFIKILNVESFALVTQMCPNLKDYVADKRLLGDTPAVVLINSDEFWQKMDGAQDTEEKAALFKTLIKTTLKNILKLETIEEIDDSADFQVLGIDSLMMLEMKNSLQNILGSRLHLTQDQLKDCTNIEMLADRFVDILEGEDGTDFKLPTEEELNNLIEEDSKLPDHISVQDCKTGKQEIQTVLLTGVTGVLGPYVLKKLTNRPQILKVFCLIRSRGKIEPKERLKKRLEIVGISDQVDLSKVDCIKGDIAYDKFGLSQEAYETLAGEVDSVIHCAVRMDHIAKYWNAPEHKKVNVRTVNVKGTLRLLEFAVFKILKYFYFASTLFAVPTTNSNGSLSENWQDIKALQELKINPGYPVSKFIAEQLMQQAIERGIPGKVFRFGMIGGDSKTGRHDYLQAHIVLQWLAYMKLGCMPELPMPVHIFPVDYCAKFSLEVFLNPEAPNEPYNVTHPHCGYEKALISIAKEMGIEIKLVSFSEFVAKLNEEDDNSPLALFKETYAEEEQTIVTNFGANLHKSLRKYLEDGDNFFRSAKMPQYIPNYDDYDSTEMTMRRDIKFLKDSGVFEKFGIKY